MKFQMEAIGQVSSSRSEVRDDQWDQERAVITLDPALFTEEALWGLAVQPRRPNRIGTTLCRSGRWTACPWGPVAQPGWATELMRGYW
ncbi:hypothetical protein LJ753_00915 [Arthrobacter sp. zg-Y20]|uniref:hypothetical protein n=1 Tax=unclassified Arthrobacter TaxID=235627 RepID=UPI001D13F1CF|nr:MULTISPECIES: hypothetical protein [unclassified Arthrobacter]MCC3274435.1 hypothetical protein [Arthrobacter sp. zg-Y20]MDK1314591.1 hypothetical protein [Arthrobacter sp. zg.Y20]WIB07574.1 hypothetical protein QNO06_07660 [Arthrobacter sp. zg-Y20]